MSTDTLRLKREFEKLVQKVEEQGIRLQDQAKRIEALEATKKTLSLKNAQASR